MHATLYLAWIPEKRTGGVELSLHEVSRSRSSPTWRSAPGSRSEGTTPLLQSLRAPRLQATDWALLQTRTRTLRIFGRRGTRLKRATLSQTLHRHSLRLKNAYSGP